METILQGWLIKSPPEKKSFGNWKLFGPKWRRRWFVLYAPPSVEGIPDAYTAILEYYTNRKLNKKCGSINLAECEEVMSALDSDVYRWVWGLQTKHKCRSRMYYLVTEKEIEMNKWVSTLIRVLGLAENDDRQVIPPPSFVQAAPQAVPPPSGRTVATMQSMARQPRPNFSTHPAATRPLSPDTPHAGAPFSRLNVSEPNLLEHESREQFGSPSHAAASSATPKFSGGGGSVPDFLDRTGASPPNDCLSPIGYTRTSGGGGGGREFMQLPPRPGEIAGMGRAESGYPPGVRGYPRGTGGTGARDPSFRGAREGETYDQPKQSYYNEGDAARSPPQGWDVFSPGVAPGGASLQGERRDECYDVPPNVAGGPPGASDCYDRPPTQFLPPYGSPGTRGSPGREIGDDFYNVPPSARPGGLEERKSVPGRQLGRRSDVGGEVYNVPQKHASADGDLYNVPQKHASVDGDLYNVPQKQVYDGRATNMKQQSSGLEGDVYNVPQKQGCMEGELPYLPPKHKTVTDDVYNVPQKHENATDDVYNVPQKQAHSTDVVDLPPKRGTKQSVNFGDDTYDTPANSAPPPKPSRIPAKTSPSASVGVVAPGSGSHEGDGDQRSDGQGGMNEGNKGEVGDGVHPLTSKHSVTYKQNDATSINTSPSYLSKKPTSVALQDSIRFTQRSKSFKRSVSSQRRAAVPMPTKRITERNDDSSSSSDDADDD